eukprot:m.95107 g.95107  ORF g.95107 m.95107 type:complete len:554 (+) comp8591_c0_seq2:636-2297(+)
MYDHFTWRDDRMFVATPKSKGDQDGSRSYLKAVFANPIKPAICPILTLAIYELAKAYRCTSAKRVLFQEKSLMSKFSTWLTAFLKKGADTLKALGVEDIKTIGSHSLRKGICTSAVEEPGGPSAVAIYKRALWALGGVQDRYFMTEGSSGSDSQVGRVAAGLPVNDIAFASLPPHFAQVDLPSADELRVIFPDYNHYPASFHCVLPFLLASLVHHSAYILRTYGKRHPIFSSQLFQNPALLPKYRAKIKLGIRMNPETGMVASGIPPHILTLERLAQVEIGQDAIRQAVKDSAAEVFNAVCRRVDPLQEQMLTQMGELPAICVRKILEHIQVNGAHPVTPSDMQRMQHDMMRVIQEQMSEMRQELRKMAMPSTSPASQPGPGEQPQPVVPPVDVPLFTWGGALRRVPEGWTYPRSNVACRQLWMYWHFGVRDPHTDVFVGPLRHVVAADFDKQAPGFNVTKASISKAKRVMSALREAAVKAQAAPSLQAINTLDIVSSRAAFAAALAQMFPRLREKHVNNAALEEATGCLTYPRIYQLILEAEEREKSAQPSS